MRSLPKLQLRRPCILSAIARRAGAAGAPFRERLLAKLTLTFFIVTGCIGVRGFCTSEPDSSITPVPVLLELFTSEGCSSCPPAEAFLQIMDSSQPIPGARLIVLSEHVDYWDHDGWKNPFSSHAFTERQADYLRALNLSTDFTPQIILSKSFLVRGDAQRIQQMLTEAASSAEVPLKIASAIEPGPPPVVRLHIEAVGTSLKHPAKLLVASALDHVESNVLRGENGGKHLTHVAVAEEIKPVGKLEKGKEFNHDFQLKLKPGARISSLRSSDSFGRLIMAES